MELGKGTKYKALSRYGTGVVPEIKYLQVSERGIEYSPWEFQRVLLTKSGQTRQPGSSGLVCSRWPGPSTTREGQPQPFTPLSLEFSVGRPCHEGERRREET